MRGPFDGKRNDSLLRREASRAAKAQHPGGKAIGRIAYFEVQRGMPPSSVQSDVVRHSVQKPRYYLRAIKARKATQPSFEDTVGLPVWQPIGPNSIPNGQTYGEGAGSKPAVSGRCVGIVVDVADSNLLTLCSGGGGLWRSVDRGVTWQPLTDDQPTLSMGALAAAPSAPNILYAGTGEGDNLSPLGMGLLRSSDAGLTWRHLPAAALAGVAVYDIAVDPANAMHLWVGTTRGLFESSDGGATWVRTLTETTWDISVNPGDPREILAATQAGLQASKDGGVTWRVLVLPGAVASTQFARMEVCHAPLRPGVVYVAAASGGIAFLWRRATAAGAFKRETIPSALTNAENLEQAWYDWCFAVSPDDPDLVYWGVVDLFRGKRASNGQLEWGNISSRKVGDSIHPDQHHIAFDPRDPKILYVCNDGGLFRSPDRGKSWQPLNKGLSITEFEFLAQMESDPQWIMGGTQDNGTLIHDVGRSWKQIALGDGGDCGVDEPNGLCYHSYYGMWIERAASSGPARFRWRNVSPPFQDAYSAMFYPPMDVLGTQVAKAGVSVFVSGDSGDHWNEIPLPTGSGRASSVVFASARRLFVGTEKGKLFRIDRTGDWSTASAVGLTSARNGYLSDIVQTTDALWISFSRIGGAHVYRSLDGGVTWADRSQSMPNIPVNAIVVDPKNVRRVFAATDHGVYQTLNAGDDWTLFNNGLPSVVVSDLILHETQRKLRAGTKSRGAWEVGV